MGYYILFLIAGYILGSFPTAYLVVKKFTGKDIRKEETGNVGAMNTARVTGKFYLFFIVFFVDALKGFLAMLIPWSLLNAGNFDPTIAYTLAAFGAVLGHCFSIYFKIIDGKFAGGKAVSTMAGILLFVDWFHLLVPICIFMLLVAAVTRNFFASQFFAALVLPIIALLLAPIYFPLTLLCVIPILYKQSSRVIPFLKGKEPKLYFKPKSKIKE
ncbi:MAG TPA: glycerol-3-phosphate acyltransferase [Candidatus Nitrosocosmicus sp.]|nr:glycerol-3-phosphate acyltransferase [Candidatus Nitrosocosmicus sp.]